MDILVHAYCTHRDPPPLEFPHRAPSHRRRDRGELDKHLQTFAEFCTGHGSRKPTPSLTQVLGHLERVQHHFSFEISQDDFAMMQDWCWESNTLLFFPDKTVRDPAGRVLVDPETGQPEPKAELPFPLDARERKVRSEVQLRNRLIDVPDALPPVPAEIETELRSADEVAWRVLALFLVAVRAESTLAGKPISLDAMKQRSPLAFQAITADESAFLKLPPNPDHAASVVWRYEAIQTLLWAMGIGTDATQELKFPDEICDVPAVAEVMLKLQSPEFVSTAKLREKPEILDAADLNYRMLWAARQAAENRQPPPASIDGCIVSERQHALNWLIRFQNADWDNVDIPT